MKLSRPFVAVLDVGHGNATIIASKRKVAVIDGGEGQHLNAFLTEQKLRQVNYAIVSHADTDHYNGLIRVLENPHINVKNLYANPEPTGRVRWSRLVWGAPNRTRLHSSIVADTQFRLGDMDLTVLYPSVQLAMTRARKGKPKETLNKNTLSVVLRLDHKGIATLLLPGDLDRVGLELLSSECGHCTAKHIVFPHHGGLPGSGVSEAIARKFAEDVVKTCKPQSVLYSNSRSDGNPRAEIVEAVRTEATDAIHVRCTQLATECAATCPTASGTHLVDVYHAGAPGRAACAGTMILEFSSGSPSLLPAKPNHDRFISANAGTALCKKELPT